MDAQQLASKVTQLESRVATLEDEGKIVKGEVKQILTEIRSAILVRDNPFDSENALNRQPAQLNVVSRSSEPVAKVEVHLAEPETHEPAHEAPPARAPQPVSHTTPPAHTPEPPREPTPLYALPTTAAPERERPQWSLLTIAALSAWAEDAMERIGSLRLEILLDLCEASGHITPEAREALSRVTELDLPEPNGLPSTNETASILRQLEALVGDIDDSSARMQRQS